jgi:hypothetical protein
VQSQLTSLLLGDFHTTRALERIADSGGRADGRVCLQVTVVRAQALGGARDWSYYWQNPWVRRLQVHWLRCQSARIASKLPAPLPALPRYNATMWTLTAGTHLNPALTARGGFVLS